MEIILSPQNRYPNRMKLNILKLNSAKWKIKLKIIINSPRVGKIRNLQVQVLTVMSRFKCRAVRRHLGRRRVRVCSLATVFDHWAPKLHMQCGCVANSALEIGGRGNYPRLNLARGCSSAYNRRLSPSPPADLPAHQAFLFSLSLLFVFRIRPRRGQSAAHPRPSHAKSTLLINAEMHLERISSITVISYSVLCHFC